MSGIIFGLGFGTIIIIFLIVTSFVLCCVSLRTQTKIGPFFVAFSAVVMLLLLSIPRDSDSSQSAQKIEDPLFIPRLGLALFLGASAVAAFCFIVSDSLMTQTRPKLLRQ